MSARARTLLHPDAAPGFAARAPPRYAPDLGLEPVHLDLQAQVDVFAGTLEGQVDYALVCRTAGTRAIVLDAVDLDVSAVTGSFLALALRWGASTCSSRARPRGRSIRCVGRWHPDGAIFGASHEDALGERPVFAATDHETERARYWLPCVDHPTMRPRLRVRLTADARMTALSNGARVGRTEHGDGTATTHWELDHPCPSYLLYFVVGDLVQFSEAPVDGVPVEAWAPRPFTAEHLRHSFDGTRDLITWITGRLGVDLPWPKYSQFAAAGVGGAMENISLVSWDDAFVADAHAREEFGWLIDMSLHELAHTWFGDKVVCRDFAHSWLKESWATYMESVWFTETQGATRGTAWLLFDHRAYTDEADGRYVRPIQTRRFNSSWDLFDAHLYPGGAWRLHMLRHKVGEEAFWEGTRAYLQRFGADVAEGADFRRCLEAASGQSLARFFEQWFESPGCPKLKAAWSYDADKGQGTSQSADPGRSGQGCRAVRPRRRGRRRGADGGWSRHTSPWGTRRPPWWWRCCRTPADRGPQQAPPRAGLRPGPRPAPADPDPRAERPWPLAGVRTLCKGAPPRWRPCWTRGAQADFLMRRHRPGPRRGRDVRCPQTLVTLLAEEANPQVLSALTEALGGYRDPRAAAALRGWLDGEDPAACVPSGLGRQRDPGLVDLLVAHAEDDAGWWGWAQRGALQGLGATGAPATWQHLRATVQAGSVRDTVYPAAVEALGTCGKRQPSPQRIETAEILSDLVRHPRLAVRLAAGRGSSPSAGRGRGALGQLEGAVAVQQRAGVQRTGRAAPRRGPERGGGARGPGGEALGPAQGAPGAPRQAGGGGIGAPDRRG